jgi:myo-inositol-1(or 4)-monophosphatase
MGTDEFTSNHSRPQTESEHSMLSPMNYESLLAQVVQLVEDAGLLLITEWQRPEGPRGSGDKADIESPLVS